MKTIKTWNKEGMGSTQKVEDDMLEAIREKDIGRVKVLLDGLCRAGAYQSLAAYEARKFIREEEMKKRRGRKRRW